MNDSSLSSIETPSGKGKGYENFPVGSWIISPSLRPHIAIFYNFARTIDDIADNPNLEPEEKIKRLVGFRKAIAGHNVDDVNYISGHRMRVSLNETKISPQHCFDLIQAFTQDAIKDRYDNWDELLGYCQLSAAPVGRYLLDLHGESVDVYEAADALCIALQVLNHLQDCQDDFRVLNRVYLPTDLLKREHLNEKTLDCHESPRGFGEVVARILEETNILIKKSHRIPSGLKSRRLALETQVIIKIAEKLSKKLSEKDLLRHRVILSKPEYFWCCMLGVIKGIT